MVLRKIAKCYGARYKMLEQKGWDSAGGYHTHKNLILINKKYLSHPSIIISTIFHELGHRYCILNNKFAVYHKRPKKISFNHLKKIAAIALRAELYVDKWGEKEFNKWLAESGHVNDLYYCRSYQSVIDRDWLKNFYQQQLNKFINI
jgi:hypothetical protein